jgi:hypothetical protein
MLIGTRLHQPLERPSALQLAIREWQRQLVAMTERQRRLNGCDAADGTRVQRGSGES